MPDYVAEFPYLNHLVGGYFHQDWTSDGATSDEVVAFYCRKERLENRRGAISDIDRILKITETEEQLSSALRQFGCAYRVDGDEESIRGWLQRVRRLIKSSLDDEH